ncbi:MAG: hypothetical protein FJW38_27365 [Acidobacteria bacterium]|nr:hypothetical protein [Acidobacteriota bacterium]
MDWKQVETLAREAYRAAVNEWIGGARIQGGKVNGPELLLSTGGLARSSNIEQNVLQSLSKGSVPPQIAQGLARALASAWNTWAAGFQMRIPKAFPTLAAVPGRVAPRTPTAPILLRLGSSSGERAMQSLQLAGVLTNALRSQARMLPENLDESMRSLATWVGTSFEEWKGHVTMVNLTGGGSVPTFAPPYVPVGPVIQGEIKSAGPLFAGPRFGKIAI